MRLQDRELQLLVELLPKEKRGAAAGVFVQEQVEKGQYVCMEGDRADYVFLVEEGTFEVVNIYGDGRVYIHGFLYPGDLFGEAYFYESDTYPYSVQAREDSLYWKARGNDFIPFVQGHSRMEELIRVLLGEKLEQYLYKARCIAGEKVERRIACVLMKVVKDRGIFEECAARLDVPLTNRDIAGLVGSTEETVSRVMSRLKKEQIIGTDGKFLLVKDPAGLRRYFDDL
jgi:CRP/FNR family transcriptional regulator